MDYTKISALLILFAQTASKFAYVKQKSIHGIFQANDKNRFRKNDKKSEVSKQSILSPRMEYKVTPNFMEEQKRLSAPKVLDLYFFRWSFETLHHHKSVSNLKHLEIPGMTYTWLTKEDFEKLQQQKNNHGNLQSLKSPLANNFKI